MIQMCLWTAVPSQTEKAARRGDGRHTVKGRRVERATAGRGRSVGNHLTAFARPALPSPRQGPNAPSADAHSARSSRPNNKQL